MKNAKISRRSFLLGLAACSVAGVLTACKGTDAPSGSTASSAAEQPASSAASSAVQQPEPFLTEAEFPPLDGSTACIPLMAQMLADTTGMDLEEARSSITVSTTAYAWENFGPYDTTTRMLVVYEAPDYVKEELQEANVELEQKPIGVDALVFIVNEDNPVQALTRQQLRDIYAGKITNWKDVGGKDQEIVAFQRGEDSGSQTLFKKLLIQGGELMTPPSELAPAAMGELVDSIADYNNSANAIGFSVYYYIDQMYSKPGLRLLAVDGVTDVIENRQAVHVRFENEESSSGGMCDLLSDRNRDQMEAALVSGTLPQDSHSIALDMEYAEDMIGVDVGSVIKLTIGDQEIPVTVSGLLINDGLKNGHGPLALDSTCMVATKELFQEAMPMIDCFDYSWSIVSDPQKAEQIENSLSAIISSDPDLALDTIGIHKDYEEMENRVVFGGLQALSWLVFLFGVVNLINTTLSNQMSRKRENSVFRAIGLTRKQLCQMTIYEGICYAFSAALATLAVGLPIAMIAARKFSEMTFHGAIMPYSFPFLQMGLFVLVLFGLEVILSFWTMRRQKNQSLVEEMRAME